MKHPLADTLESDLAEGLAELGVELSEVHRRGCVAYLLQLLEANNALNLTRITEPRIAVRLHLLDSLAALPEVSACPAGPLLDIGTGGGFPGVPLSIASRREAVLLDSVTKKANAVRAVVDECHLSRITVVGQRAEEYALMGAGQFAGVLARAVAPLPSLVELGAPFLADGGRLVFLKARPTEEEVDAGDRAAAVVGVRRSGTREFALPCCGEQRTILAYERVGASAVNLPRRVGLAQSRPLG